MITLLTFVLGYDNVHGRILAVNMAHLRKKRQIAESSSLGDHRNNSLGDNRNSSLGGKVFNGIQEVNKGKEASAK